MSGFEEPQAHQLDGAKFEANWYEFERSTVNCGRLPGCVRGAELSALGTVAAVPAWGGRQEDNV